MGQSEPLRRMTARSGPAPEPTPAIAPGLTGNHRTRRTVGIDLGTTNSVIALLQDGADLLTGRDPFGRPGSLFPSLVGWDQHHDRLVAGLDARSLPGQLPLSSIKRHMGLARHFQVGPKKLTPVEASALILRELRSWMLHALGGTGCELDQAVITMPAYFNHNQIEATRQAGEMAQYEVVELLHEPTAAAIYYSWLCQHGDATYLVYDLGGGTFDVSLIRRRLGDHEVLSVSGDPFLGGDDFDRLLASRLVELGRWKWDDGSPARDLDLLFDPLTDGGAWPFQQLIRLAEQLKSELSQSERCQRYVPRVLTDSAGRTLSLEVEISRKEFEALIRDKLQRTLECCQVALSLARERVGLRLGQVDHVILVGGSSRVPLVRQMVESAFVDRGLPEHVRSETVLWHEPDLCVAYGAALRAANHGTRHVFALPGGSKQQPAELELHLNSPPSSSETIYPAAGVVRVRAASEALLEGASVRIRSRATGLTEEAFLDEAGSFSQDIELVPETANVLEWTVLDNAGQERGQVCSTVQHRSKGLALGRGVLPTQLIVKPLSIEILTRGRQRIKQVLAPVGAPLPGRFRTTCRTSDQSGRIVVPVCEENRVIKQLVIQDIDRSLPVGTAVHVEFVIDTRHKITVSVSVEAAGSLAARTETASIEPPPPPRLPGRGDIEQLLVALEQALDQLSGRVRARIRAQSQQAHADLLEALSYGDEPRAIQRMAELRDLLSQAELARTQALDPPWVQFTELVRRSLELADEVARYTGQDAKELVAHIRTQERYAEQAHEELNQALYRECWDNLERYAHYLTQLLRDSLPAPTAASTQSPLEAAREEVEAFRSLLQTVWKQVRTQGRKDLDGHLAGIARQGGTLLQRLKDNPLGVLREARQLHVEVQKVHEQLQGNRATPGDTEGLLSQG